MNALAQPRKWENFFWPVLAAALLLLLWHYSVVWTKTKVFPSPLAVERGMAELSRKGLMWAYIGDSLRRVALGFGAAAVVGIPLGLTLGWYPRRQPGGQSGAADAAAHQPHRLDSGSDSHVRRGETDAGLSHFPGALFPIVVSCVSGVSNVPAIFRRAGRNFGLTAPQLLARVVFPAALPQILVGCASRWASPGW
jgi:NitT/TauT family transport system permease protein